MSCPDMGQEICLSWVMEKETQVGVKCERINRETIFPEWIRSMKRHLLNYSLENKRHFFKKKVQTILESTRMNASGGANNKQPKTGQWDQ